MEINQLSESKRNLNIQGLRGILALMVFLGHVLCAYNIPFIINNLNTPVHLFYDGQAAVMCFFVLSGYFYFNQKQLYDVRQLCKKEINKYIRITPPLFDFHYNWNSINQYIYCIWLSCTSKYYKLDSIVLEY